MIYGLYASAAGMITASHRQDVISNNIANVETTGFKRDLALFRERKVAAEEWPGGYNRQDPRLAAIGGGQLASPTTTVYEQGAFESSDNALDVALRGPGFFVIGDPSDPTGKTLRLTRNGSFKLDAAGRLVTADGSGAKVMSARLEPITLDSRLSAFIEVDATGTISQDGQPVARLAVRSAEPGQLRKGARQTFTVDGEVSQLREPADTVVTSRALERSNSDPAEELTALMDAMRQLEANANLIRYQDSTLQRLVNDVGKIG